MKKTKSIVVYSLIALLCVAALAAYIGNNIKEKPSTQVDNSTASQQSTVQNNRSDSTNTGQQSTVQSTTSGNSSSGQQTFTSATSRLSKEESMKHNTALMAKSLEEPDANPVVGIGRGEDYKKVTLEAIENAGGLKDIIKKGDVVLLKPNICTVKEDPSAVITDYRVVQVVADLVKEYGASKVIVGEGTISGNTFDKMYLKYTKYGDLQGVELFDFNGCTIKDCYALKPPNSQTGKVIYIPKVYMDADIVIDIPKLKTHSLPEAVVSLSLKNSYGIPPGAIYGVGGKLGLHDLGFISSVIDINMIRKPDFAIIDGIVGGEGDGPLRNTPVKSNIIFAGKDLVAVDTSALTFMGFNLEQTPYIRMAGEAGLGITDLSKIKIVGADLNTIKMHFKSNVVSNTD